VVAIVVGADGSEVSNVALRWAVEEAGLRGTTVRAVHVWDFPPLLGAADPFFVGSVPEPPLVDGDDLEAAARALLARAVAEAAVDTAAVRQEVVQGQAADRLLEAAKDEELLVVGSRGHSGIGELLLGSVTQACVRHATCPVVVVPA
jgi:nucleotide-binding universal stress UspA family protein